MTVYPSMLQCLALEAKNGRLKIAPKWIFTSAEPLFQQTRDFVRKQWHVPVFNVWAGSEGGIYAWSCGKGRGMHLNEDLHIIEAVDDEGRLVPSGVRAEKIYLTNLFNNILPLIRYEITDQVTFLDEPCPCGSTLRRIEDVGGRPEDPFTYDDGVVVHSVVFNSAFERHPNVAEFQVRQTPNGVLISVLTNAPVDLPQLERDVQSNLKKVGLLNPEVSVTLTDRLDRAAGAAKLRRFVPLPKNLDV
jgi:phenylacetate-coenzyme A ligase PaaK-like adenylate-forming protein